MDVVLVKSIEMLWQGMLGVFVVIGGIAFLVSLLSRLTNR